MIYKRKSVRKYESRPLDDATVAQINEFCSQIKPLYPDIKIRAEFVDKENVKCILPWIPPQVIAFFSEEKDGYLENAGFMFQQLDLYLQSLGLGTCWLGMGRLDSDAKSSHDDGFKYVIMLAVGFPDEDFRDDISQFNRKEISEISDVEDERLKPAQYAPSSVNSQPWYFSHEDDVIHAYCSRRGLLAKRLWNMNVIDMGIALAHIYVSNPDTFRFFKSDSAREIDKLSYIGSFTL